jgi:glycosyltransferase involved in cell wall biosynthesis
MTQFHFVVAAHNAGRWIGGCLYSLIGQRDQQFTVNVVDDGSTDNTYAAAQAVADRSDRVQVVRNVTRMGAMYSQHKAITRLDCDDRDVVVIVDGDDQLAHPNVLGVLAGHYDHIPDLVLTYGSYEPRPPSLTCIAAQPYPASVSNLGRFRTHGRRLGLLFNHLRTFRVGAYRQLDPDINFRWPDGTWFKTSCDAAVMIPLLEMARTRHRFIPDVLYFYNSVNPASDWRQAHEEVSRTHLHILQDIPPVWRQ